MPPELKENYFSGRSGSVTNMKMNLSVERKFSERSGAPSCYPHPLSKRAHLQRDKAKKDQDCVLCLFFHRHAGQDQNCQHTCDGHILCSKDLMTAISFCSLFVKKKIAIFRHLIESQLGQLGRTVRKKLDCLQRNEIVSLCKVNILLSNPQARDRLVTKLNCLTALETREVNDLPVQCSGVWMARLPRLAILQQGSSKAC